jgi:chorismate-pyruvate lyase
MKNTQQQLLSRRHPIQESVMRSPEQELLSFSAPIQEPLMRNDLKQSLNRHHIKPSELSALQRILLTTDGTLTDILEACFLEEMQVVKLSEELVSLTQDIPSMQLNKGTEVISKKILLRGRISRKNFIYAESIIVPERLDEKFRDELLQTKTPLSKFWLEQRTETFKEILDSGKEPANGLSIYFNLESEENMLFRTYNVFSNRQSIMMITEKFPESYFRQDF